MDYNTAEIREFLTRYFNGEELETLCFDYFRDVYDNLTGGMTKGQMVQLLLEYCERRGAMSHLLAALEKVRPEVYRARFAPAPAARVELAPTARDPRQVFISHAHEDAGFAHRLAGDLQRQGWRVWIAPDSIRPGERWVAAINRGLEECGVFVLALTPAAVQSRWVKDETDAAIELEKHGALRFFSLDVAPCYVPPLWNIYQRISFRGRYEDGLAALLKALASNQQPVTSRSREQQAAHASHEPPARLPFEPEMILIPAGEFLMGSDPKKDRQADYNEKLQHRLYLPDYYLARTPITNTQYLVFVRAKNYRPPEHWTNGQIPPGKENHPVVNVTWQDAMAYCRWLSKATGKNYALPSEAEWEKGARGVDGRIYPWGDEFDPRRCNSKEGGAGDTTEVGAYPNGASPYGLLDMAGNVWEWTRSIYKSYKYDPDDGRENLDSGEWRVVRGGSFAYAARSVRCAFRGWLRPGAWHRILGFRCVLCL